MSTRGRQERPPARFSQKRRFKMQRRRSHTLSILLGTGAKTALPGDPFRLGFIRLSRVLWLSVLVVMLGGCLNQRRRPKHSWLVECDAHHRGFEGIGRVSVYHPALLVQLNDQRREVR